MGNLRSILRLFPITTGQSNLEFVILAQLPRRFLESMFFHKESPLGILLLDSVIAQLPLLRMTLFHYS